MFAEMNVQGCFPTPIWVFRVADHENFNRRLLETVEKLRAAEGIDAASIAGKSGPKDHVQSRDDLHTMKEFAEFNALAIDAARNVFDFLKCQYETFYLTSLWFNISVRGYSHKAHVHPNNYLSGVYYAKAHDDCGRIVFDDPRPQVKVLIPDIKAPTEFNTHSFEIQPRVGDMVLFPSWLTHRVQANASDHERMSVSFNVMFKGRFGFERAYANL